MMLLVRLCRLMVTGGCSRTGVERLLYLLAADDPSVFLQSGYTHMSILNVAIYRWCNVWLGPKCMSYVTTRKYVGAWHSWNYLVTWNYLFKSVAKISTIELSQPCCWPQFANIRCDSYRPIRRALWVPLAAQLERP